MAMKFDVNKVNLSYYFDSEYRFRKLLFEILLQNPTATVEGLAEIGKKFLDGTIKINIQNSLSAPIKRMGIDNFLEYVCSNMLDIIERNGHATRNKKGQYVLDIEALECYNA